MFTAVILEQPLQTCAQTRDAAEHGLQAKQSFYPSTTFGWFQGIVAPCLVQLGHRNPHEKETTHIRLEESLLGHT